MCRVNAEEELARAAVEALLRYAPQLDDYCELEGAEVIWLEGRPGVAVTWSQTTLDQGFRRFGLLMTVHEMLRSLHGSSLPSDAYGILADLRLAFEEPHGTKSPEEARTWFRNWP
jgi:hypothetical protein